MLKLYGNKLSGSTQPVLWYLDEQGIEFELIPTGGEHGGNKTPEYLAKNPNGLVPTLVDGDHVLWESTAIARYLATRYGKGALYPDDWRARSKCEQWLTWCGTTLFHGVRTWYIEVYRNQGKNKVQAEEATAKLESLWGLVDAHLGRSEYLAGDQRTLADVFFLPGVHRWMTVAHDRAPRANLERWFAPMRERPQFARVIDQGLR